MAKIDTLKFTIDGKEYTSNVNVGKAGVFKVQLHWQVAKVLGLENTILGSTKDEVVTPIITAYNDYLDSKKTYELFISIVYKASKKFSYYKNGYSMFSHMDRKFYEQGYSDIHSKLFFGFKVYCKETTSTGAEVWHDVEKYNELEKDRELYDWEKVIDGFLIGSTKYGIEGTIIPYTKSAYETLEKAQEGIRGISEILYTFLNQEPGQIANQLNKGNLLKQ